MAEHDNFIAYLKVAQKGFDEWAQKPHNKRWFKKIDGTPIPNDLVVCIAAAFEDVAALAAPVQDAAPTDAQSQALAWYAENVAGCRRIGAAGDQFRQALDRDGGALARTALAAQPAAQPADAQDERAAFEAWMTEDAPPHLKGGVIKRDCDGDYLVPTVRGAWEVWQARAALAAAPAATQAIPSNPGELATQAVPVEMGRGTVAVGTCTRSTDGVPGIVYLRIPGDPRAHDTDCGDIYPVGSAAPEGSVLACVYFLTAETLQQSIDTLRELQAAHYPPHPSGDSGQVAGGQQESSHG